MEYVGFERPIFGTNGAISIAEIERQTLGGLPLKKLSINLKTLDKLFPPNALSVSVCGWNDLSRNSCFTDFSPF